MAFDSIRQLPLNVWILAGSQSLALSAVPMLILVSGLLAAAIAPDPKLSTLPIALVIASTALSTVPAAWSMRLLGRKGGGFIGFAFGLLACGAGFMAARSASFEYLLTASLLQGVALAYGQQFRFAALESVRVPALYGPALSVFMTGGLLAAFLGPELGARGQSLIDSPHGFAGSFVLLAVVLLLAIGLFSFFREPAATIDSRPTPARSLGTIARSPLFLAAVVAAAGSYMVMSFIMTATPITMYELCGFKLVDTKRVIQGHILAMYLPSLCSGWLIKALGAGRLMALGALAYAVVVVIGIWGQELMHFWLALVLLGVGWNFLFVSGTALLPLSYAASEKFKAQALNDFIVFCCQATAALSAGWYIYSFGWNGVLLSCLPLLLILLFAATVQWRRDAAATKARTADAKKPAAREREDCGVGE